MRKTKTIKINKYFYKYIVLLENNEQILLLVENNLESILLNYKLKNNVFLKIYNPKEIEKFLKSIYSLHDLIKSSKSINYKIKLNNKGKYKQKKYKLKSKYIPEKSFYLKFNFLEEYKKESKYYLK